MPWDHCETTGISDDSPCPECETTKDQWTLEFNVTRNFVIKGPPALRVVLFDLEEEGVEGEAYRIELPDGSVEEGELDDMGTAKVRFAEGEAPEGAATISFPARAFGRVVPYLLPSQEEAAPPPSEEDEEGGDDEERPEVASFTRPCLGRHRFQLCPRLLQLTLYDWSCHHRLCFTDYTLEGEGGERFEGTTDGWGRLDHGEVEGSRYTLTVDDETVIVPAVVPANAFQAVRVPQVLLPEPARHHDKQDEAEPNPRWSTTRCRFHEVVELIYECPSLEEGAPIEFRIYEHDAEGEDDFVLGLGASVVEGEARIGWRMLFVDDSDDEPSEVDEETGFALPEFVFTASAGEGHEVRCDQQLVFSTDLELPLRDEQDQPLRDTAYELRCGDQVTSGRTDGEGVLRAAGVGPNLRILLEDGREVLIQELEEDA